MTQQISRSTTKIWWTTVNWVSNICNQKSQARLTSAAAKDKVTIHPKISTGLTTCNPIFSTKTEKTLTRLKLMTESQLLDLSRTCLHRNSCLGYRKLNLTAQLSWSTSKSLHSTNLMKTLTAIISTISSQVLCLLPCNRNSTSTDKEKRHQFSVLRTTLQAIIFTMGSPTQASRLWKSQK